MDKILNAIVQFLEFANNYWTVVIIIIGLSYALYEKVKKYAETSKEEKIEMARKALKENLLKYMADAEIEWSSFEKSGEIKRAQVISKIYQDYPILKEYVDQDELIKFIDDQIDNMKSEIDKVITSSLKKEGEE